MSTNRRHCKYCGGPLKGMKQRMIRCCLDCANDARENFTKMGAGQFKEGLDGVLDQTAASVNQKREVKSQIKQSIQNRPGQLKKLLKKRGLSNEEISEGMTEFKKGVSNEN